MTEMTKTATFVVCGLVAAFAAWATRPDYSDPSAVAGGAGEILFPDFEDPFAAANLAITEYDEELGEISTFEIDQKDGNWVIPTHDDYPADADKNFKDAATLLVGLKAIDVVSEIRGDHELYGVKAPDPEGLRAGDKGVGKMLVFKSENGNRLAELIIGESVKGNEDQRYVRIPSEDQTYIAEIDPSKISTSFDDWIKDDLLELSSFDVQQMELLDYSVQPQLTPRGMEYRYEQRFHAKVDWTEDSKWELAELSEFRNGQLEPTQLLETEELNTQALNDMKSALDDLTIVDVRRKPEGLRADLSADKGFSQDQETVESLVEKGYFPAGLPDGRVQLFSSEGEVICRTKNGVEYTLRFGGIAIGQDESKLNRYVMVTAALNEAALPRPELEDLPKETEESAADTEDGDTEDATDDSDADSASDEVSSDGEAADAPSSEETNEDASNDAEVSEDSDVAEDEEGEGEADQSDEETDASDGEESDFDAERDRITRENQRKLDEYKEKREKAEQTVGELNLRFAPWYYVISEDVYKKLHLSRADLLKEKEGAEKLDTSIDAFRNLEESGLKQDDDTTSSD